MNDLKTYISESVSGFRLSEQDKARLLELDREYNVVCETYQRDRNSKDILNLEEECEKFLKAREKGEKYFPKLRQEQNKFSTDGILERIDNLIVEFYRFNCPMSKYYIQLLEPMRMKVLFSLYPERYLQWYLNYMAQKPSMENYKKAMDTIKEHPYEPVDDSDRNIPAKDAAKMIQQHIDKLGYGWEVDFNENMIPRMAVSANKKMYINPNAKFSETDIEGLKAHEVEGHIGRRYYGLKTGLYLFLYGLLWRNDLDEGLAVWNSLNKVDKVKPNVMFNIALKTIIAYHLSDMDFCELFDYCKSMAKDIPDESLFKALSRFKKEIQDCSIMGGNGDDHSYFCGLQIVDAMDDKGREDILKYNIGPGQISELPDIKRFLELNKFEPLI